MGDFSKSMGFLQSGSQTFRLEDPTVVKDWTMFADWQETLIWSALQGIMGEVYVERLDVPESACIVIGDFAFLAGNVCEKLVTDLLETRKFLIVVCRDKLWEKCIRKVYPDAQAITRYAFHKEPDVFDRNKLCAFAKQMPEGYVIRQIDAALFRQIQNMDWCRDFCSQFSDYEQYRKLGGGFVALYQGEVVAGASSYTAYHEGIEIEIDTRADHRRKGLALCCAARLILFCLDRGLYPSWDAANQISAALAQKLGYHYAGEYRAWLIQAHQEDPHAIS